MDSRGLVYILSFSLLVTGQTWFEFEGHCYTVLNIPGSFDAESSTCLKYGSYMLEMEEKSEMDFIRTVIGGRGEDYWVGLSYDNATQKYKWIRDGQEAHSSFWHTSEPNYSGQCVRLTTEDNAGTSDNQTYKLSDYQCSSSLKVICEKYADMLDVVNYRENYLSADNRCPIHTFRSRSKVQCAHKCAKNKFCIGFTHDDDTLNCTHYKFDVSCSTNQTSPLYMYVMEYARC